MIVLSVADKVSCPIKRTILLIDDDEVGLKARQQILATQGYGTIAVTTAVGGLAALSTMNIDLVVVDYQLPNISGTELLTRLRNTKLNVPIILLSGRIFIPESAITEVDGFFRKGEGVRKLLDTIKRLLPPDEMLVLDQNLT
jgi:CheY-like chemotaxis protein